MYVTILTPTFNRAQKLVDLYNSLSIQTMKDFEWIVIDDGSKDNTREVVDEMIGKADFSIKYLYKTNGGKHTALNMGIELVTTELVFIVDSDDYLDSRAIEIINKYHNKYKTDTTICGYSFLRMFPNGKINGKLFEPNERIDSYIEVRINSNDTQSDKAEVYKTLCLKEFPFPVYKNEKFLGEDIVWVRMGRKYNTVHINEAIYVGEYQMDGLTHNRRNNNIKSPLGCMYRAQEFTKKDININYRIKATLQIIVYGLFSGKKGGEIVKLSGSKSLTIILFLPGVLLFLLWRKQYNINGS